MARSMIWFTCCIDKLKAKWDLAVVPSYKGVTYAPIDADTFRIMKLTKNPDAAFTVLQYLQGEAASDLLGIYNAFPARPDLQPAYIATVQAKFPFVQNWSILAPGLEYAVIPYHESVYPNFRKGQDRLEAFRNLIYSDAGKAINVDAEFDKLQTDLEKITKQ